MTCETELSAQAIHFLMISFNRYTLTFSTGGGEGGGGGVPPHRHNGGAGDTVVTDEVGLETAIGIRLYCECTPPQPNTRYSDVSGAFRID